MFKKALEDSYDGVEVYQSLWLLKSAFDIDGGVRRRGGPSTFSFIIHDDDGKAIYAGDSDVFESLEDKDEFVTCVNEVGKCVIPFMLRNSIVYTKLHATCYARHRPSRRSSSFIQR